MQTKNAVEFENVYFRYRRDSPTILRNVNLTLEYGAVVLLTGMSGEGKTTLMSLINGTIPNYTGGQFSGTVRVNGESVMGKSISGISSFVGSVLQNADSQIVHDIVKDEIAFGPENLGAEPEAISASVKEFTDMLLLDPDSRTRHLSGGQKQRLITASTLAMGQKILLLDEPLANLDTAGADLILTRLRDLAHNNGYLVLITEHRIDRVLDYADRVLALRNAEPVEVSKESLRKERAQQIPSQGSNAGSETVLSGRNISMNFGSRQILKEISLDIKQGEKILIMGENGCGKTTLTKILARLIQPSSGQVLSPLGNKGNKAWYRQVGYVYQNPDYQLFLPTVRREIEFACVNEELKNYVTERLNLKPLLDRHPFSLSEGQKRKVTVAAIVCMQPKLLFLDEPTVGQDSENLANIIDVLLCLNKNHGTALVSVTHDLRCAKALGDRIVLLPQLGR